MNSTKKQKINWGAIYCRLIRFANPGTGGLSMAEKAILSAIADHMFNKKVAWPGYDTIAHFAGCNRSTAIRTVQKLIDRGFLQKVTGSGADSNHYQIETAAVSRLITDPDYQERAQEYLKKLLAKPAEGRELNDRTGSTVPPHQWQDATPVVAPCHPSSGRTPPEDPKERPTRTRSKNTQPREQGDLRSGQGEQGRLSDFIKNHEVAEIIGTVETLTGNSLARSTRPIESVATSVVTLFKEIYREEGRYPSPEEVADAIGDPVFAGLRGLSFGLLTAPAKQATFKEQLVRRIRDRKLRATLFAPNAADLHDRAVEEVKRESAIRSAPVLEQGRLPLWLERLREQNPDDPDVKQWVAEELAKARPPVEPAPVPPSSGKPERPIGYDLRAAIEEDLLAISLED